MALTGTSKLRQRGRCSMEGMEGRDPLADSGRDWGGGLDWRDWRGVVPPGGVSRAF